MKMPPALLALAAALLLAPPAQARRGALVKDGMSSKRAYDNPRLGQSGDITIDPDVVAITSRCAQWSLDPVECSEIDNSEVAKELLSKEMKNMPLHVTFRSKTLAGGKRNNWMRTTAFLGDPVRSKAKAVPVRAVWTCSNPDADTSMTYDEVNPKGREVKKEIGRNVLEDSYEDCLKRVYGKYVELEVLLPKTKGTTKILGRAGPPPSLVYRVPIQSGHVNPLGMVSKSRATVTLYPKGRTLAAASASGPNAASVPRDEAIPLGLSNVHLPLGPGLVDPSWAKGRKLFWKGRSVGLV